MATKAPPKGGKKKLPKWAYVAGAVGVVGVIYYVKRHKESTEGQATPVADQGSTSQAFIPVTGENVAGAGGGGSLGGESGNSSALLGLVSEENKQNQEYQKEQSTALREYLQSATQESQKRYEEIAKGLTGGGAPSSGQAGSGAGTASPPSGGSTSSPPPPPSGTKPPSFHSIKCPNGCEGHYYSPSHIECQTKVKGKCSWPA
jgi:hypothetical protein